MKLSEKYIAPPVRTADVVDDPEWVRKNFQKFIEFFYSEHPAWEHMMKSVPETYARIAKKKGLPVFRVGLVSAEKLKLRGRKMVRIVYIDEGDVAVPVFVVDERGEFIPV